MVVRLGPKSADTTLTLMGEVVTAQSTTNAIVKGINGVSFPYSQDIKLKDTDLLKSGLKTGKAAFANADQLWMWNVTGRVYKTYAAKAGTGVTNWYTCDANWGLPAGLSDDVVVNLGSGFWVRTVTNVFSWVETNRYNGNLH